MLTFHETDKKFEIEGSFLKLITNKIYNVDLAKLLDKKVMFDFAKEMYFDEKTSGNKNARNKSLIRLLQSPAIMVSASGVSSSKRFLSSNPKEICGSMRKLLQEKRAGKKSDIINEKTIAMGDRILDHKCISSKTA